MTGCSNEAGQRDEAYLRKAQCELPLQQGVNRQQDRLHQVVQKMRETDRTEDTEARALGDRHLCCDMHGGLDDGAHLGVRFGWQHVYFTGSAR
jgi:hypothetical protein